jgi:hypothetical protein
MDLSKTEWRTGSAADGFRDFQLALRHFQACEALTAGTTALRTVLERTRKCDLRYEDDHGGGR